MANYRTGKKKALKCMNSNPDRSKWGDWAPEGGCDMVVEVDENVNKILCWKCTQRTVNETGEYRPHLK